MVAKKIELKNTCYIKSNCKSKKKKTQKNMPNKITLQYDFAEITNILHDIKDLLKPKEIYNIKEHDKIKGLYICENIITNEEEKILLQHINNQNWLNDLSRRVQHYGYKYDYKKIMLDNYQLGLNF